MPAGEWEVGQGMDEVEQEAVNKDNILLCHSLNYVWAGINKYKIIFIDFSE